VWLRLCVVAIVWFRFQVKKQDHVPWRFELCSFRFEVTVVRDCETLDSCGEVARSKFELITISINASSTALSVLSFCTFTFLDSVDVADSISLVG
jgi:hypothetical protein